MLTVIKVVRVVRLSALQLRLPALTLVVAAALRAQEGLEGLTLEARLQVLVLWAKVGRLLMTGEGEVVGTMVEEVACMMPGEAAPRSVVAPSFQTSRVHNLVTAM